MEDTVFVLVGEADIDGLHVAFSPPLQLLLLGVGEGGVLYVVVVVGEVGCMGRVFLVEADDDGVMCLKVYYERKTITLTFNLEGGVNSKGKKLHYIFNYLRLNWQKNKISKQKNII